VAISDQGGESRREPLLRRWINAQTSEVWGREPWNHVAAGRAGKRREGRDQAWDWEARIAAPGMRVGVDG
jgi:hypothetical protein